MHPQGDRRPHASTLAPPALAALSVFATVPEWGALAQELGGDKVNVYIATNALQDPHHVEAKPSLIARARNADLVVATGAELEVGWLPLVLQQAGNPKVQPGTAGLFRGRGVRDDDRASRRGSTAPKATCIRRAIRTSRPTRATSHAWPPRCRRGWRSSTRRTPRRIASATRRSTTRWRAAIARWEAQAAPLRGVPVLVQHKDFST